MTIDLKDIAGGTGYIRVNSNVVMVVTRFQLKSVFGLTKFYLRYLRIRKETECLAGLISSGFLIESTNTCLTLSIWRDEDAIKNFNLVAKSHIDAANRSFNDVRFSSSKPQVWSAQFQLDAVSPHNLNWKNVGISSLLDEADVSKVKNATEHLVNAG